MTPENYARFVDVMGIRPRLSYDLDCSLASMGIAGEMGEMIDVVKKTVFHQLPLDREKFIEEAGDGLHYFIQMLNANGVTLQEVIDGNVTKLQKRYPNGWVPGGGIR